MTQNEKDILLKDLCGRLPYGVVIQEKCVEHDETFLPNKEGDRLVNIDAHTHGGLLMTNCGSWYYLDEIKPYLFPMSSMTEEQNLDYLRTCKGGNAYVPTLASFEWCDKNHFDYRGLIPMGLANDATGLNIY